MVWPGCRAGQRSGGSGCCGPRRPRAPGRAPWPASPSSASPCWTAAAVRSTLPVSPTTARVPWRWRPSRLPTRAPRHLRPAAPSALRLARTSQPSQSSTGACAGRPGPPVLRRPACASAPAHGRPLPPPAGGPPSSTTSSLPPRGRPCWGPEDPWPLASQQPSESSPPCLGAPHAGTLATAPPRWLWLARRPLTAFCCPGAIL